MSDGIKFVDDDGTVFVAIPCDDGRLDIRIEADDEEINVFLEGIQLVKLYSFLEKHIEQLKKKEYGSIR